MALAVAIAAVAVALPLVIWPTEALTLGSTYGRSYQPFELMALIGGLGVLGLGAHWIRQRTSLTEAAPGLALMLICLSATSIVSEYSQPSWDWGCYAEAGKAVLADTSPYGGCYIYPPLFAQVLAAMHRVIEPYAGMVGIGLTDAWPLVYLAFQV